MPQFSDIGKKAKDFFGKGFTYKTQIKNKQTSNGVTFETEVTEFEQGKLKVAGKPSFGKADIEVQNGGTLYANTEFSKLAKGVSIKVGAGHKHAKNTGFTDEITTKYAKDGFAGALSFNNLLTSNTLDKAKSTTLDLSGTMSHCKLTVGGTASLVTRADKGNALGGLLKSYDFGAQYNGRNFTASVVSKNGGTGFVAGMLQNCGKYSVGTQFALSKGKTPTLDLGVDYALCKATQVKTTFGTSGMVQTAVNHQLSNPNIKVYVASKYDAKNNKQADFGFGLTF